MASAQPLTRSIRIFHAGQATVVSIVVELIVPAVLLGWWWFGSAASSSFYFPSLSTILTAFVDVWVSPAFFTDAVPTLTRLGAGLLIAAALGISLGVVLGMIPILSDMLAPITEYYRAIPGVALIPAALLLLGIGPAMQISLIVYGAIWPILLNTIDGVRGVDSAVLDTSRSYRIGKRDRIFRIVLPAAGPQIVAGVRTALSIGITIVIISEMVGATNGIGFQVLQAQRSFAVPDMWAGMLLLGLIGFVLNLAFRGLEARILRWHRGMRAMHR